MNIWRYDEIQGEVRITNYSHPYLVNNFILYRDSILITVGHADFFDGKSYHYEMIKE
jgi:hypothetical protein